MSSKLSKNYFKFVNFFLNLVMPVGRVKMRFASYEKCSTKAISSILSIRNKFDSLGYNGRH